MNDLIAAILLCFCIGWIIYRIASGKFLEAFCSGRQKSIKKRRRAS